MLVRERHPLAEALRRLGDEGQGDSMMLYQKAESLELTASSLGLPGLEGRSAYQEAAGLYYKFRNVIWNPLWTEDPNAPALKPMPVAKAPVRRGVAKKGTRGGKRKPVRRSPAERAARAAAATETARPTIVQPATGKPFDTPDDPSLIIEAHHDMDLTPKTGDHKPRGNAAMTVLAEVSRGG